MAAGFKFQARPGAFALNDHADLFKAAEFGLADIDYVQLPASAFDIHAVHPIEIGRKERAFFPSDAAADLHDDIFAVVRILRQQQDLQLLLQFIAGGFRLCIFLLRKVPHLRIIHQLHRGFQVGTGRFIRAIGLHQRRKLPGFPVDFGIQLRIGIGFRLLEPPQALLVLICNQFQLIKHRDPSVRDYSTRKNKSKLQDLRACHPVKAAAARRDGRTAHHKQIVRFRTERKDPAGVFIQFPRRSRLRDDRDRPAAQTVKLLAAALVGSENARIRRHPGRHVCIDSEGCAADHAANAGHGVAFGLNGGHHRIQIRFLMRCLT